MNPADRLRCCDRCPTAVPPKFEVLTPSGELLLCGRHGYQHADALIQRYSVMPIAQTER